MAFEPADEHRAVDVAAIREFFPSLTGEWTFFDNAGGSQMARPVLDRINEYLLTSNVQHGASYDVSRRAGERLEQATSAVAEMVNASGPDEIVMGPSSSMLVRMLAESFGRTLDPGDEIIVSNGDHEANIGPWVALEEQGATIKFWNVRPETCSLHLVDLDPLLSERTRLVAVTHVSNVLGQINPIRAIAARVHDAGALLCVDGVAFAPHRRVDVRALDADFYFLSFYKLFGPHHAMLYGRREHLLELPKLNFYFIDDDDIPYKFQPGNVNYELGYGTLGVVDYLRQAARLHGIDDGNGTGETLRLVFDKFATHEQSLTHRFLEFLDSKRAVRVIGPATADRVTRVSTVSFRVDGADSADVVSAVDRQLIGIRYGDFYSKRLIEALGLASGNGVVRLSMAHYNTREEVDRLIEALDPLTDAG